MPRVYLDTSFFIGLLENQENRQQEARKILEYEGESDRFTSILTINEFLTRVYDQHKHDADCEDRVKDIEIALRSIARVVGLSDEIDREAAFLQSLFGEIHKHAAPPKEPRDRKFRWDALHLATARIWKCERIYAWDGKWDSLPGEIKERVGGEIIAPARCPGLFSVVSQTSEDNAAATPTTATPEPTPPPAPIARDSSVPIAQPPPSAQSPAVAEESASPPEPSPPSNLPAAPKLPQPPE